jgi:hypothetical protein
MGHTKEHSPEPEPRVTIFTIPRAFTGEHRVSQENTLGSWVRLSPRPEILLFCDDPGVAEAAGEFGCVHVPDIRCNRDGIPYVGHAFHLASQLATSDVLCYANADIIFIQDLITAIDVVAQRFNHDQPFLIIGQRWDVAVPTLKFTDNWQQRLWARTERHGNLHPASAIDYFIYSRGAIVDLPDFLVGSPKWDNWLVKDAEDRGLQVVSATEAITCIHQRHKHMWPAAGVRYNHRLWQESGGGVGRAYSGSWVLGSGAKLRSKTGAALGKVTARPRLSPRKLKSPRPARVTPRDELDLPLNLNIPAQELVDSAKRLRRRIGGGVSARGKHSHSGPTEKEVLLAERARLRQIQGELRAARVAARDARIAKRKRERAR